MDLLTEITLYTDGSAIPNPGYAGYGFYGTDNLKNTYNGFGPVGTSSTNNAAELTAILRALHYVNTLPNKLTLTIHSDSKYALDNLTHLPRWERNQWVTSSGSEVANVLLWKAIQAEICTLKKANKVLVLKWVKGHNGVYENEQADKNANKGRLLNGQEGAVHICEVTPPGSEVIEEIVKKGKTSKSKTPKVTNSLTALITGKRWFFNTNQATQLPNGKYFYTATTYKDDKVLNNQNLGKRNPDTHYSILLSDNPISELDSIRDKFNTAFDHLFAPVVVDLAIVTKSTNWKELINDPATFTTIKGDMAVAKTSAVLGKVIVPPKLVFKLQDIYLYGFKLIDQFNDRTGTDIQYLDITDHFLSPHKEQQKLADGFTQALKAMTIQKVALDNGETSDIILTLGVDVPARNAFSALLKQTKEPISVTLMVFEITLFSFRVVTVVNYGTNLGIYYTPDANYKIIPKKLLKG